MSAWLVSKAHIDVLVHALGVREMFPNGMSPDQVGQMLWDENVKSLDYRYEGRHPELLEGHGRYQYSPPVEEWSPGMVLAEAGCYDYQACEHPEYATSVAHDLVVGLTTVLRKAGAVEADAPWGVPECGHTHAEYLDCPVSA